MRTYAAAAQARWVMKKFFIFQHEKLSLVSAGINQVDEVVIDDLPHSCYKFFTSISWMRFERGEIGAFDDYSSQTF
jgi:hypothetical protein